MARRGYRTIPLELKGSQVPVRASPRVADALEQITKDMTLFDGVKLGQVLESVYVQGRKDGARDVFDNLDSVTAALKEKIKHRGVGRPRKKK